MFRFFESLFSGPSRPSRPAPRRARPALMSLEERDVPASLLPFAGQASASALVRTLSDFFAHHSPTPARQQPAAAQRLSVNAVPTARGTEVTVNGRAVASHGSVQNLTASGDGRHYAFIGIDNQPGQAPRYTLNVDGAVKSVTTNAIFGDLALSADGSHHAYSVKLTSAGIPATNVILDGRGVLSLRSVSAVSFDANGTLRVSGTDNLGAGIWTIQSANHTPVKVSGATPAPAKPLGGGIKFSGGGGSSSAPAAAPTPAPAPQPAPAPAPAAPPAAKPLRVEVVPNSSNTAVTVKVNGSSVGTYSAVKDVMVSPDGRHYAFVGLTVSNGRLARAVVVVDGSSKGSFDNDVQQLQLGEGGTYAYVGVHSAGLNARAYTAVVNGSHRKTFDLAVSDLRLSADGKHFAYVGKNREGVGGSRNVVVVDGSTKQTSAGDIVNLTLSPDGRRHAYAVAGTTGTLQVVLDGRNVQKLTGLSSLSFDFAGRLNIVGNDVARPINVVVS